MITFTITAEQRQRAQMRAAELDLCLTDPPGKFPYVWDNRQNCVKRWYDYESGENKIGTIYFEAHTGKDAAESDEVICTTEITWHQPGNLRETKIADEEQHEVLVASFLEELLCQPPRTTGRTDVRGTGGPTAR